MLDAHPGLLWLLGGVVLIGLETQAPGAFMVWIGLAAVGTGLATLGLALSFPGEVVVFAVLAAISIAGALRMRRARRPSALNTPESGLIGRTAYPLSVSGREGRVRIGDSDWAARLAAGANWPEAAPDRDRALEVVGIDGCVVLVRPRAEAVVAR